MTSPLKFLAAVPENRSWADGLVSSLATWPIEWHLMRTDRAALECATTANVNLCVLDNALPGAGGLELLRSFRRMGFQFPCLLVCDDAAPRLLKEALALDVFSVVGAARERELLVPTVIRMVQICATTRPGANESN